MPELRFKVYLISNRSYNDKSIAHVDCRHSIQMILNSLIIKKNCKRLAIFSGVSIQICFDLPAQSAKMGPEGAAAAALFTRYDATLENTTEEPRNKASANKENPPITT